MGRLLQTELWLSVVSEVNSVHISQIVNGLTTGYWLIVLNLRSNGAVM
jgi:hypothetical protein